MLASVLFSAILGLSHGQNCFKLGTIDQPFSSSEVATMRGYFMKNINIDGKGGVVAAPDYNTPGGSYYFHWMRDGALSMRCVQETSNFDSFEPYMKSYTNWVLNVQSENDPNGIDVRTEPKFNLPNGDVYAGGWCRPQNDGPGVRATALIMFANSLIANNQTSYVNSYLWTGSSELHGGAIKYDLDYIVDNYASSTCDLWEEYKSNDLYWNRATMRKAMLMGSAFAITMGDVNTANTYTTIANKLYDELGKTHWTGSAIIEASGRTYDGAVIVGLNTAYQAGDELFGPLSYEVASTVFEYNKLFCNEYYINRADTNNGVPGVLYGRYEGDIYAGGNPWILTTAALGNLFYRGAIAAKEHGLPTDPATLSMWGQALNVSPNDITVNTFVAAGDSVMNRLRYHVAGNGFHLDEQLDKNTGYCMSAHDLTWSYAEVLNAMRSRDIYFS